MTTLEQAAERADVTYDTTYDGVQIGDCTIEACIDGFRVYHWRHRDPTRDGDLLLTTSDPDEAVAVAADHC